MFQFLFLLFLHKKEIAKLKNASINITVESIPP